MVQQSLYSWGERISLYDLHFVIYYRYKQRSIFLVDIVSRGSLALFSHGLFLHRHQKLIPHGEGVILRLSQ
jgi:hypothetical protein